jgi:hypothetical protein
VKKSKSGVADCPSKTLFNREFRVLVGKVSAEEIRVVLVPSGFLRLRTAPKGRINGAVLIAKSMEINGKTTSGARRAKRS